MLYNDYLSFYKIHEQVSKNKSQQEKDNYTT